MRSRFENRIVMLDCEKNAWCVKCVSPQAMRSQTEMELRMFKENEHVYLNMREAALTNKHTTPRLLKSK